MMTYYVQTKDVAEGWDCGIPAKSKNAAIALAKKLLIHDGSAMATRVFQGRRANVGDLLVWDSRDNR
jgi:hypothetical protein